MDSIITRTTEAHFEGLYLAIDTVAREGRFLAFQAAPPRKASFDFYRRIVEQGLCQFIALDGDTVLGWCDILPQGGESCAHVGVLGMGLLPHARHRGVGSRLLREALDAAWAQGMARVELSVRASNAAARALYLRHGFEVEGIRRRAYCVDGCFEDGLAMALLRP